MLRYAQRNILIAWVIFSVTFFNGIAWAQNSPMISPTFPEEKEAQEAASSGQQNIQPPRRKHRVLIIRKKHRLRRALKNADEDDE